MRMAVKAWLTVLVTGGALVAAADPFCDAKFWMRGAVDADASGTVNLTNEYPNALRLDDATHWAHKFKLHSKSTNQVDGTKNYPPIVETDVISPFFGTSVGKRKCIQFNQTASNGGFNRELLTLSGSSNLAVSNTTGWAVYMRVKPEGGSTVSGNTWNSTLSRFCQYWSKGGSGVKISIYGSPAAGYWGMLFGSESVSYSTMGNSDTTKLMTNKWTDLVLSVTNNVVKLYSMREGGTLFTYETTLTMAQTITSQMTRSITIGGHEDMSGSSANFVGQWSDLAHWTRPLDEDEVMQIFKRGESVSRNFELGVCNGSAGEFMGAANGTTAANADSDWRSLPPTIAPGGSATVKFDSATNCHNACQALVFTATPGSAEKELDVSLNGHVAGKLRVKAGESTSLIVKAEHFTEGENTLTLGSDSAGGVVEIDAVTLAGGWQYGARDGAANDLATQSGALNFYIGNTNCTKSGVGVKSILHCGGKQSNTNCIFHVAFPEGMEAVRRFRFHTRAKPSTESRWYVTPGSPVQQFQVLVNDVFAGRFSVNPGAWTEWALDIPGEMFDVEKDNTVKVQNMTPIWYDPEAEYNDPKYDVYAWTSFDYFRFEPLEYRGIIVNFR